MSWYTLFFGEHGSVKKDDCVHLPGHTSSVSIVQDEGKVILIDTGARHCFDKLLEGLNELNLNLESITDVVLTHFHLDHAGNVAKLPEHVNLFAWQHNWKYGETVRMPTLNQYKLTSNVTIFNTPGHTPEHNAILYEQGGMKIIFAGDAINEHYFQTGEIKALNFNDELYRQSADWIISQANIIIPGHGPLLKK